MLETILSFVLAVMPGMAWQRMLLLGVGGSAGGASPSYVNSWSNATGSSPLNITVSPSAGHTLAIWAAGTSGMNFSFSDNQSSTYTVLASSTACDARTCGWAYLCSAPSGLTTLTISNSGSVNDYAAIVIEVANTGSPCLDQSTTVPTGATSTSTPTSANITTTSSNTLLVGFFESLNSSVTFSSNAPYTLAAQQQHDGGGIIGCSYRAVSSIGTYAPSATISATDWTISVGMAFK